MQHESRNRFGETQIKLNKQIKKESIYCYKDVTLQDCVEIMQEIIDNNIRKIF